MKWLELKLPPVIVVVLFGLMTALASRYDIGIFRPSKVVDVFVVLPALLGIAAMLLGAWTFHRARTTVDPRQPQAVSNLVTSGIYAYTRNPMYVGMCLLLLAVAIYFATWLGFVSALLCGWYLNQFQIKPEERIIAGIFGQPYLHYKSQVRRWL